MPSSASASGAERSRPRGQSTPAVDASSRPPQDTAEQAPQLIPNVYNPTVLAVKSLADVVIEAGEDAQIVRNNTTGGGRTTESGVSVMTSPEYAAMFIEVEEPGLHAIRIDGNGRARTRTSKSAQNAPACATRVGPGRSRQPIGLQPS
ncbi:MAG: hypothetical protein KUG77_17090, partial [Nannocystaceae bacterium]|nr:hypothetical protein [Nannocystaceae bacterium]